jgi:choline dehydrogenase-like flavoprotein
LLLEAGRDIDPKSDIDLRDSWDREHEPVSPRQQMQGTTWTYDKKTRHLFVDDLENPYATPSEKPFHWIRSRQVGGRTLLWNRVCLRMSDYDFQAAARDGHGENWPFSYEDLRPYYEKVERAIGVSASDDRHPYIPDGGFSPAPLWGKIGRRFKDTIETRWPGRNLLQCRRASIHQTSNGRHPYDLFPSATSPRSFLSNALATGRLTIRPGSVVSRVLADEKSGKAAGVEFVDKNSSEMHAAYGSFVLLCASTIETVRLLLNSETPQHEGGIGNRNGLLGRYLMDHVGGVSIAGTVPMEMASRFSEDRDREHLYIPRFQNMAKQNAGFLRGYGTMLDVHLPAPSAEQFRFYTMMFGEVLPQADNRVTIGAALDAWGIPAAHIEMQYSENERRMAEDAFATTREMMQSLGITIETESAQIKNPGESIHEVGGARMGQDPQRSVVNAFNQCWEMKNLLVLDGACFASSGAQNPTLTMMAIAARACDHLHAEAKRGET